jgi:hypothetical protein
VSRIEPRTPEYEPGVLTITERCRCFWGCSYQDISLIAKQGDLIGNALGPHKNVLWSLYLKELGRRKKWMSEHLANVDKVVPIYTIRSLFLLEYFRGNEKFLLLKLHE